MTAKSWHQRKMLLPPLTQKWKKIKFQLHFLCTLVTMLLLIDYMTFLRRRKQWRRRLKKNKKSYDVLQVIQTTKLETGRNRKAEKWGEINWEVTGKSAPFNSQNSSFVFCCFKGTKAINRIYLFIFIFKFKMKNPFQLGNSSSPLIVSDIVGASSLYWRACMFQESSIGCSLILHFFCWKRLMLAYAEHLKYLWGRKVKNSVYFFLSSDSELYNWSEEKCLSLGRGGGQI